MIEKILTFIYLLYFNQNDSIVNQIRFHQWWARFSCDLCDNSNKYERVLVAVSNEWKF